MRFLLFMCLALCVACAERNKPIEDIPELTLHGIDISHHNGAVNWQALRNAPVDFIYLKATEGRDWKDPRFQDHWKNAHKRGYKTGAYHFYLLCKSGRAQADNFIQTVGVRRYALPPAIDLEYAGNCKSDKSPEAVLADIEIFLAALEEEYGKQPIIYTTKSFYRDWISARFKRNRIWIRSIGDEEPTLPDGRDWLIWQYSGAGLIPGLRGPVDMNHADASTFP